MRKMIFGMCLLITKDYNVGLCPLLNNIQKIVDSRARIMKGGMTFEIDKGWLSIRLTAPYTEERRKASSEYAKKYGVNHIYEGV